MSDNSASLYFYCLYLLSLPDYLSAPSISFFEKFWENVNIRWVLESIFWNTCWKLQRNVGNFENIFKIFWNYFVELFRIFSWNLLKTLKKSGKSKFWILENCKHRGNFKLLILRKLRKILKMFLSRFNEMVMKFWRKVGNTLYKFLDILKRNFVTFLGQFLEKLVKNYPKNMKLFWKNFGIVWRSYKIIILGIFWKFLGKYVH